jgi:hypothetical protein
MNITLVKPLGRSNASLGIENITNTLVYLQPDINTAGTNYEKGHRISGNKHRENPALFMLSYQNSWQHNNRRQGINLSAVYESSNIFKSEQ